VAPVATPATNLTVTALTLSTVALAWTDGFNEERYRVIVRSFSPYSEAAILLPMNTTSFVIENLPGYHCFQVRSDFWYVLILSNEVCSGPVAN
jgi:hypothetical protein